MFVSITFPGVHDIALRMRALRMHALRLSLVGVAIGTAVALVAQPLAWAQSARWPVDTKPQFVLGASGDANKAEFAFVNGATKLPDGNIMVGDRGDYSMFIVSPADVTVKKFGRNGDGPGELRSPFFMWRCGSAVFVSNGTVIKVFGLDGTYQRSFRFGSTIGKRGAYRSSCNQQGTFVHYGWDDGKGQQRGIPFRTQVPVWISPGDSTSGTLVSMALSSERFDNSILPLGRETRIALGKNRVYVGEADSYEIRVFTFDGRPLPSIRKDAKVVAVSAQDIKDDLDRTVAMMGEKFRKVAESDYARAPMPKTLPPYRELVVDIDDNLWVRDYARTGANVVWTVFNASGKQVAELQLPNALEVSEIGRDYVLGRYISEETGAPEVRSYRLVKR